MKYFQKLKEATGATINLEKTIALPINTDNISNLPQEITIKEQFKTMKILGIYLNEDLHNANQINWETILDKMEKHINKLYQRILSLCRKVIIINTLILSKTLFLSNVFPIDTKTTQQIHKRIFQYIWNNKQEPIARKTIFLKKKLGGLNLIELQAHNIAIKIKHLLQLKQNYKTPPWKNLATYWLAIYQKIIQEGLEQHKIAGETLWKKHLPTIEFKQIWKNTFISYAHNHSAMTYYTYDYTT